VRFPTAKPASPATRALEVVPPSGPTAWLTSFTAGAMTFLCVFALALSLASGRLADPLVRGLAKTATIRLSAPEEQVQIQTDAILAALATTPGIASYRLIDDAETTKLLEPWFGPGPSRRCPADPPPDRSGRGPSPPTTPRASASA
jgi:cell division transport system permease protein